MATFSWNNGDTSGNWSDASSWFDLATPDSSAAVVLAGTGPYSATVDVLFTVASVAVESPGVTLDIASTLSVANSVSVAAGASVEVAGMFAAGTLDLTGGGAVDGEGGTLAGTTVLGQFGSLGVSGVLTNTGSVGWSAAQMGTIAINGAAFANAGRFVLGSVTQVESEIAVTAVNTGSVKPYPEYGLLNFTQTFAANTTINATTFDNTALFALVGAELTVDSTVFDNAGTIEMVDASSQSVQQVGFADGYAIYGVVDTTLTTELTVGAQVATFQNTGVITADTLVLNEPVFGNAGVINVGTVVFTQSAFTNTGSIIAGSAVFEQAMTLAQLGNIAGGLTFDAGLDLGGGTLAAATVSVAGLVQDGSIGGTGTLVLQSGATLDNVAIGTGVTVQEQGAGPVTIIDPPGTGAAVTLDAVIDELEFRTVGSFNGSIVLAPGAANDVVNVMTPGGLTLGPDFSLINDIPGSLLTFGGTGSVLNTGTWSLDGSSLDLATTLDNAAAISIENNATAEFSVLDGSGSLSLNNGALVQVDTLAAAGTPSVSFGDGTSQLNLPGTGAIGAVLSGLTMGDEVDFFAVSSAPDPTIFVQSTATVVNGSLDLTGASGDQASVAVAPGAGSLSFNLVPDGNGGTIVQVACFAAGTRLATGHGEAAVETLRPGDVLRTAGGRLAPVRWVGCTRVDLRRHTAPQRAAPIRIRAGAFAPGVPRRDLLLSAEHCLLVGGALVPAAALVNGATIARLDGCSAVTYWHVELDRHDVLLAEGLPAESYLDTGNRALFAGEAGVRGLHADFAGPPDAAALAIWARHGCAELRLTAPEQRATLRARAEALGWRLADDAAIAVLADGVPAPWTSRADGIAVRLPAGTRLVRLRSRSFVPAEQQAGSGDARRLGLAVASVCLGGWKLHPDALREGWHIAAGEAWRWTDGDAAIVPPRLTRPGMLDLRLEGLGRYWQAPAAAALPAVKRVQATG